ncbi:DUF2149 domain-containing protein [Colwellia sp. 1_MG-2023]|jgi:hypothetical protein|uniref:DUF2149 domain-containing protein n=1 Tax=unclassified Colwellia TaxID=196834 RepID=UPI001C09F4E3|nr:MULTISPECIES: DUF2149 domain-containing protein [unclassified Colwellia]MBU2923571.1 DUF2149 domain-containing protein [Colwellia sp. C2M11]MDO6653254.1 DUF2149 domain-containing protein [Colwellia sp. 3_MG-2023]MDO6664501.1 DUF2149 domain-containing protein [Colwellia sp. 2_MG-2023]MDO6688852.1 DUF2149 domain-containing protein [Colwellia sp. 1_MG-2023]
MRFLDSDEADDPILSVVNLVDLFLVIIGILLTVIAVNPLSPFSNNDVVVIENPGKADMKVTVKQGEKLTRYESNGEIGEGQGTKAGETYQMEDGSLIYVPSQEAVK